MAKKIVYIHEGDMVEVRFCPADEEATAAGFKTQTRSQHQIVSFPRYNEIEAFDPFALIFEGTGDGRRQLISAQDRFAVFYGPCHYPTGGWAEFQGTAPSLDAAKGIVTQANLNERSEWWQIVNLTKGEIAEEGGS